MRRLFWLFLLLIPSQLCLAQTIAYIDKNQKMPIGGSLAILEDKKGELNIDQVASRNDFIPTHDAIPNLGISNSVWWVKFTVNNKTDLNNIILELEYPTIDQVELYTKTNMGVEKISSGGDRAYKERKYDHQNYLFDLKIPVGQSQTYFLKLRAAEQLQLPMYLGSYKMISEILYTKDLIFGIYIGIILVMALYNLFVFVTVRDKSYIYYVLYILFVGLTQATLQGYAFKYLWPNNVWIEEHSTVLVPVFNGLTAIVFIQSFLNTKLKLPLFNTLLSWVNVAYLGCLLLSLFSLHVLGQNMVQFTAMLASIIVLIASIKIARQGDRTAKFFLVAWFIFLVAVCVFVLRNFNMLPYNNFTYYALQAGSAIEVTLLSFALGDKINILKAQKQKADADALRVLKEKERLVLEQNAMLESKVTERTQELQVSNKELKNTLNQLKNTQSQLVEAEKMASLGQLTAGIAHEINNPINFVSSNVKPLQMDIDDLFEVIKKYDEISPEADIALQLNEINDFKRKIDIDYLGVEINNLLQGIEEGASRTAEIVKGLRTFSRLDESELKAVDIHECIDSTFVLLRHFIPENVKIIKNFDHLDALECFPGKLNQALMNIFNNALQAMKLKGGDKEEILEVSTQNKPEHVIITIRDTGCGMPESVKRKIFEPFFTTKDVGEGTGLGLSIVFNIIEKHNGNIAVDSEPGVGTTFTLTLPKIYQNSLV
ncbi:sensor histidine kinase [Solitalea koreensis]|uniref:histidine kinase n=1 Tax=Solitalea koreensis TaxID=543615 RepID=A0A521EC25_9SPHI|nr:7TM diverse intracellular signaling domain-containing protein [Solitalea koreensis]SMO81342.1 hypothetical protein SAMN06265350_11316 [Solitalea koreensis]